MTTCRPLRTDDLFRFGRINLDVEFTETYNMSFYLKYLGTWPEQLLALEGPSGQLFAYLMGKTEGKDALWHGHVTAITVRAPLPRATDATDAAPQVASDHRRLGAAGSLMRYLEQLSDSERCYFVDLFVRVSNVRAIDMYRRLGYSVYRRIKDYYSGESSEDAFDMRKALSADAKRESVRPVGRLVTVDEIEFN